MTSHGRLVTSRDTFPRSLSDRESEILHFLLAVDDDRLAPLREQAATAYVTGMCGCGCATIDLAVDRERTSPASLCSPVVSADTPLVDERSFGLLVFLDEGWLSGLEIYYFDTPPPQFPAPDVFNSPRFECEATG
jgi:hypothetical protein